MFNKKPCPFCGSHGTQELSCGTPDREGTPCAMACTECGAIGPWRYVSSDATPGTMMFEACEEWDERAEVSEGDGK